MCITDVVVAAQPFVRAEGLPVHLSQRRLVDVSAWYVPSRREPRFVEHARPLGIGDDTVLMTDHEVAGSLTDVDTVVAVRGVAEDPFVFFIKGLHGVPRKGDPRLQLLCVPGQLEMLPGSSRRAVLAHANGVPGG